MGTDAAAADGLLALRPYARHSERMAMKLDGNTDDDAACRCWRHQAGSHTQLDARQGEGAACHRGARWWVEVGQKRRGRVAAA